jgi:hypothetical protein
MMNILDDKRTRGENGGGFERENQLNMEFSLRPGEKIYIRSCCGLGGNHE